MTICAEPRRRSPDESDADSPTLDETDLYHCSVTKEDSKSLVYPGAGLTVRIGQIPLTAFINRKEPNVYQTEKAFIALHGYISNIDDLCQRMGRFNPMKTSIFNKEKSELTIGDLTAQVILNLFIAKSKDPLLTVSELQGHFAFVIYDSEEKCAFAARDASGSKELYYSMGLETGLSLSNVKLDEEWMEVPAGHYLYGRQPQLIRFALTPDQLMARWSLDLEREMELYSSVDSSDTDSRRSKNLIGSFRQRLTFNVHNSCPQTL